MPFPDLVPELTDGVVRLRAHHERDVARIVEQCADPETLRWTTVPAPYDEADARAFLAEIARNWESVDGVRAWAVTDATDPDQVLAGTIDIRPRGGGLAAVGYGLHPQARGRHLMAAALRLAAHWWFEHQQGTRLTWTAYEDNLPSWAVARAAGFRFESMNPACATTRSGEITGEWHGALNASDPRTATSWWYDVPPFTVGPVHLRAWEDGDSEAIETPDHPPHWLPARGIPTPESFGSWLARRRQLLARGVAQGWCLADAATGAARGDVVIFSSTGALADADTGELGYWLSPSARGQGLLAAALRAVIAHAFTPAEPGDLAGVTGLGLRRLVAETAADNHGSNRALERAGFTIWGREEAATGPDGRPGPALHWELLSGNPPRP